VHGPAGHGCDGDGDGLGVSPAAALAGQRPAVHQLRRAEERRGAVLQAGGAVLQLQDHHHGQPLQQGLREHHQVQGGGRSVDCLLVGGSDGGPVQLLECNLFLLVLFFFTFSFLGPSSFAGILVSVVKGRLMDDELRVNPRTPRHHFLSFFLCFHLTRLLLVRRICVCMHM
jgi:hypothetical protein